MLIAYQHNCYKKYIECIELKQISAHEIECKNVFNTYVFQFETMDRVEEFFRVLGKGLAVDISNIARLTEVHKTKLDL